MQSVLGDSYDCVKQDGNRYLYSCKLELNMLSHLNIREPMMWNVDLLYKLLWTLQVSLFFPILSEHKIMLNQQEAASCTHMF